jgi:hypothetical protein
MRAAVKFAPYWPSSFMYPIFMLEPEKALVIFIDVLASGFTVLCYMVYSRRSTVSSASACISCRIHFKLRKPFIRLHHLLHKDHNVPETLSQPLYPGCDPVNHSLTQVCLKRGYRAM